MSTTTPGAWYDLTVRIGEAQAVASCALEAMPSGLEGIEYVRMNHASMLIAALEDILKLVQQDIDTVAEYIQA